MEAIKEKIRQNLATVTESTAKKIAADIGMKDYPSDVVKALSEMRTDAEVECEKRKGKGNELIYWLAKPSKPLVKPIDQITRREPARSDEVSHLRQQLADAEQVITNARNAVRVKEGESLVLAIERLIADRNAHRDDVLLWERTMMSSIGEDGVGSVTKAIEELKTKLGYATKQNEALQEQLMHDEEAVDVKDAARGYLVCAPKRKPAKFSKPETAVAKAKAMAKATGRGEVFALVPVGVAVSKKVQSVEFKEAKAA